jgi:hypothetical protein
MIRILVLVLLGANLLYLGWSRWISDEAPRLVAPESVPPGTAKPRVAVTAPAPASCTSLGPIREEVRAMEIEQQLRDMQLSPSRRTVTAQVQEGWWVYVATASAVNQGRVLRTITGAGISDAFAMTEDPEFRVSVGLFSEEARANSRADAVRRLRLVPVVSERMQEQTSTWFDLANTARDRLDLGRLAAEGVELQDLRVEACPAAAAQPISTPESAASEPAVPETGTGAPATESATAAGV